MLTINPGKFEIVLGGEAREVLVSLGLKAELYKLITKAQIDLSHLVSKEVIDTDLAQAIREKSEALPNITDEVEKTAAEAELEELYAAALKDLETRQQAELASLTLTKIDVTEASFADLVSCLLSERNEVGKIIKKLTVEEILWKQEYAEAQEELVDLVHGVVEYITSALKKISEIQSLVTDSSEEKVEVRDTP